MASLQSSEVYPAPIVRLERLSIHGVYSKLLVAAPLKPTLTPELRGWPVRANDVGVILEDNRFRNSAVGVQIGAGGTATFRNNQFDQVDHELLDLRPSQ